MGWYRSECGSPGTYSYSILTAEHLLVILCSATATKALATPRPLMAVSLTSRPQCPQPTPAHGTLNVDEQAPANLCPSMYASSSTLLESSEPAVPICNRPCTCSVEG